MIGPRSTLELAVALSTAICPYVADESGQVPEPTLEISALLSPLSRADLVQVAGALAGIAATGACAVHMIDPEQFPRPETLLQQLGANIVMEGIQDS